MFSGGGTDYTPLFRALVVQRHRRVLSDDEFLHLLKAHVDHGFQLIKNDHRPGQNDCPDPHAQPEAGADGAARGLPFDQDEADADETDEGGEQQDRVCHWS